MATWLTRLADLEKRVRYLEKLDSDVPTVRGTWTPVLADATSGGNTASASTDVARYTRISDVVIANFVLSSINIAGMTGTNNLYLRGLPYTVSGQGYSSIYASFLTFSGELNVNPAGSTTYCFFISIASASAQNVIKVNAITSASCRIGGMLIYHTG